MMHRKLFAHIDSLYDLALELQTGLTSRPAIGPGDGGDGELARAEYLAETLARLGFPAVHWIKAPDGRVSCGFRPNLYTVIPGRDRGRTFWIAAHLDVVPPGDLALWAGDPFTLRREGDFIYGRGVEDNQQGLVSAVLTGKALLDLGLAPACNLGLLFLADEEDMSELGAEYLLKEHGELFGPDDVFLVPDAGVEDGSQIEIAEKHMLWLKFTVTGKQCHASMPHLGANSLHAAAALIVRLERLYELFPRRDELYLPPGCTFSATRKEANVPNVAVIPGSDVFYFDCRILPHYSLADVLAAAAELAEEIAAKHGVTIRCEEFRRQEAAPPTPQGAPIARKTARAVQNVYGVTPQFKGVGIGTVANFFRNSGFASTVWMRTLNNPHTPDECARLSFMVGDAKVMAGIALDED